jgi:hypothetical protein
MWVLEDGFLQYDPTYGDGLTNDDHGYMDVESFYKNVNKNTLKYPR